MRMHRMLRWTLGAAALSLVLGSVASRLTAQSPRSVSVSPEVSERAIGIDRGAAALWQSLLKLHTRASLIMITAHPDDEDGGLLTYESRGKGARVALLTLNRGEAGQNLMNSDYFDAMGLLRTEELLAAGQYYGVQQYFSRVIDFGFSKSKSETLAKWKNGDTLYDAVRVVRMVRPLVVTSVFVGGNSDGHGNHQVAGQTAQEVFKDAADPKMFPDQIRAGLHAWAPLKMYARVPTFTVQDGHIWDYANNKTYPLRFFDYIDGKWIEGLPSTNVAIPEGEYDPLLGGTFAQIGREGLGFQKSQNGGVAVPPPGPENSDYHRFGSLIPASEHEDSMFAGIDVSLAGIADLAKGQNGAFLKQGLDKINGDVERAMKQFDPHHLDTIAPVLADGAKDNLALIGQVTSSSLSADAKYNVLHELRIKQAQFNTALAEALGLSVRSTVTPAHPPTGRFARFRSVQTFRMAIPGQTFYVSVRAANVGGLPVAVRRMWVATPEGETWTVEPEGQAPATLGAGAVGAGRFQVKIPGNAAYTRPYFSRSTLEQPYYTINDPKYLNLPFMPYPVSGWVEFEYDGVPVRVGQVVQTLRNELGRGAVGEPLVVAPAISLWISPRAGVAAVGAKSFPLSVLVHSNVKGPARGTVKLDLPAGWDSTPESAAFSFAKDDQDLSLRFEVHPSSVVAKAYELRAVATYDGHEYAEGYERVGYPGLRPYFLYRPATYDATGADVKIASNLSVGYIVGTGDDVPQSLEDLGIHVSFLNAQDVATSDLSKFGAIILGVRAYAARPELATYNQRLLNYVHQGGVLIVQYQDGAYDHNFGPYPFTLGRAETVTEEDGHVEFLESNNPALVWPNRIGEADFRGWIEERGHGYPQSWDPRWQALVEMHDEEQPPQKGGLLLARYGKGEYVYTALAFYRQMPEGVSGAYRIFANLLSLGRNPAFEAKGGGAGK
ncbi:MAG: PIG-L family deacetylase [Acidobacteriota bacterium]|nr:PIG-L family deacetylase [Acidobacteriota bacterium]